MCISCAGTRAQSAGVQKEVCGFGELTEWRRPCGLRSKPQGGNLKLDPQLRTKREHLRQHGNWHLRQDSRHMRATDSTSCRAGTRLMPGLIVDWRGTAANHGSRPGRRYGQRGKWQEHLQRDGACRE
jgi:hypothetical protein